MGNDVIGYVCVELDSGEQNIVTIFEGQYSSWPLPFVPEFKIIFVYLGWFV